MNCPQCGRTLAAGARKCVYCAQGTQVRPREQLQIPKGTLPKRKAAFPWRPILGVILLIVGIALALRPEVRAWVKGHYDKVVGFF